MKHKAIKLDWDELEDAFNNLNDELVYYLDLVTGRVHLEGEGEDDHGGDEDDDYSVGAANAVEPPADGTRAYVEPPTTKLKVGWIQDFMKQESDLSPELVQKVTDGLTADDPADAIRTALNQHPEDRDRWYLYRSDRIRQLIESWIEKQGIRPTEPPPWKRS